MRLLPSKHAMPLVAAAALLLTGINPADARNLSKPQGQFLNAITNGEIQKARDLKELANLDPNDFDGHPFVKWLFFDGAGQLNAMSDEAFDYVFKDLKQPFNIETGDNGSYPVFAFFCINTGAETYNQLGNITGLLRTQERINYAIANGASAAHIKTGWEHRRRQPLPRCVEEYFRWRHNPQSQSIMLAIIDTLIKAGADPNYDWPLASAAEKYDVQLFQALVDNGARADHVFPIAHDSSPCSKQGSPPNTIIAKLPNPRDKDIPQAHAFLTAVQDSGIDIMEKQRFLPGARNCTAEHSTLVERALAAGQTAYAKMVLDIAKAKSIAPASPDQHGSLPPPASPPPATEKPAPGTSRVVTRGFNVREQPHITATLLSELGANAVFDILGATPDGQWTRIEAPTIVAGWANTAVILKSSIPNEPAASPPATTASLAEPKLEPATLQRLMMLLITGLDGPVYTDVEKIINPHGVHVTTITTRYEPSWQNSCVLKLLAIPKTVSHTNTPNFADIGNTPYTRVYDFRKMTSINADYTDSPDEGMMYGFAGGASNPRLRKPRKVNYLTYTGDGSVCSVKADGTIHSCTSGGKPGGHAALANPVKRPKDYQNAFTVVKSVCN